MLQPAQLALSWLMLFYVPPISVIWRKMSSFQPVSFSSPPLPCPGFAIPSFGTKFHHPTVGSSFYFFFPQAMGMRKPMNQPYYGFMCIPCFPNGHPEQPLSICCYSALLPPNLCQPPMPCRLLPFTQRNRKPSFKKRKSGRKEALHLHNHGHAPRAVELDFPLVTVPALDQPYSF